MNSDRKSRTQIERTEISTNQCRDEGKRLTIEGNRLTIS